MIFKNKMEGIFEPLINDENIVKSNDDTTEKWVDYKNYPVFDKLNHSHPSILSNAFFLNNFEEAQTS